MATGGTDNHLVLWDLRPQVWVTINQGTLPYDGRQSPNHLCAVSPPPLRAVNGSSQPTVVLCVYILLQGVTGSKMELLCDHVCISLNKNAVYGDRSALSPGGVRLGTVRDHLRNVYIFFYRVGEVGGV